MSSRGRSDLCLICGGALQGNQRRWLFGGQNKKPDPVQTPRARGRSLSQSTQSSPWGSTLSLGSSPSLSRSQSSLSSPSKPADLLSVLTHILGQPVPRDAEQGEFLCGKCVSALERVFKFDSVIARVRVLSSERLQKLTRERDTIRQWVRQNYGQRQPGRLQNRGSASEDDGEAEKEGYREMLKENMALSEYECWSEKWDTCPYFIRTGKRCRKGKGCEGCDHLCVSDSHYESVCGVPRHLPFSPLPLSRDRSQSMPLHWHKAPSVGSGPASLAGSSLSLQASSCTGSTHSLDSLDGNDPFDSPGVHFMLKELKTIEGKPVSSPSGSKIPVLERRSGRTVGRSSSAVNRALAFEELENGADETDGEDGDVLTELRDEFVPLHHESAAGRVPLAVRHLRGRLDKAESRIRTLEAERSRGGGGSSEVNGSEDWAPLLQDAGSVLQSLGHSLRSRERLIQECLALIRRLCVERGARTELADKLMENLKEVRADNKAALESLRSDVTQREKELETEVEALRKAARDREKDLNTLHTVLQCNQDVLNDLRAALGEKEQLLKESVKERELWRQRTRALDAVRQEKEALIDSLQEAVHALQGDGVGEDAAELAALLKDRLGTSATLCQEVAELHTALQKYQDLVQDQQESHSQTVSSLTTQLADTRQELRLKEKEKKEADRAWQSTREDRDREERQLRHRLEKREQLIEQILVDAEERDQLFRELQQNLANKCEAVTAVKHTL
ncbi:uncharacterized protein si:ch73-95l15.5 isoform X2 [Betta splendens]|uniref:Uncharacterized protein si:ch73-95l15.5 isoform X2 n=1 Tax=Betta splendens TaxID=158456 RepID=A0A6P7KZ32_BETSP|nr:uncharacterized protein si:ch73-95l15.5 isoform X2 [Betta splendens]